jgi:hypothetical protein
MANTFKNAGLAATTTLTTIYTAPASTDGVVNAIFLANTSNSDIVLADIVVNDASASTAYTVLHRASIKPGSSLVFDKPINLEPNDSLQVKASANSKLTAFISILEITA